MKLVKYWLPVFLWAGLIFFLSHQPGLNSGLPFYWDFIFRKIAHIAEYAVLTFLLVRAFNSRQGLSKKQILILSVVIALLYAFSDEYHQSFILGRSASVQDTLIDGLGILLTAWLVDKKMLK